LVLLQVGCTLKLWLFALLYFCWIDENGYLILNYPEVIENVKKGEYFSYYAIIEQYIFERAK
jgi:hypothetical protein